MLQIIMTLSQLRCKIRCKCCNEALKWSDLRMKQMDGSPEDLCNICRGEVNTIDIPEEKQYTLQYAEEGVKPPCSFDD